MLGIGLLILAFRGQDLGVLLKDLQKARYSWVFASLAACLIAHIIRAIRWRMMIGALNHGTPSVLDTCYAVIIGYMANMAFPRMGEVSRCGVINKTDGIPIVKLIGTVIIERVIDLLMLCIVISIAIFVQFGLLSEFLYKNLALKMYGNTGNTTILTLSIILLIITVIAFYIVMKKEKWGISSRVSRFFEDVKSGVLSVKSMQNKWLFVFLSVLIWIFYGLSTYLCLFALDATSGLDAMAALSILVFSSVGMIAPVQGGIGAFHWMVSEGLTMYNIPKSEGLAYALLLHSSQTLLILFAGSISLLILMIKSPKKHDNEQTGSHTA